MVPITLFAQGTVFFLLNFAEIFGQFKKKQYLCKPILDKTVVMANEKSNIIVLDALDLGVHSFDFQLDSNYFTQIENSELLGGKVQVEAAINLREYDFDLQIAVNGVVQVTCDRCLDEMDIIVDAEENEWEWDEEPKQIDLSWLAYELIIVNLPLVHSHQDGGCNPDMDALLQDHLCAEVEDED